jgi:hypothetical protein
MADKNDFAADRKRIAEENEAQVSRTDGMQPTPTQEENDRAKLGVESLKELDDKESDGSPEEKDVAAGAPGSYATRDVSPAKRGR